MIETSMGILSKEEFVSKANEGTLPENLIIKENFMFGGCTSLTALPDGMEVEGYLYLLGCASLKKLPKGLQTGGWINLQGCTSLTALPSDMKVGKVIYADESFIQNYPFKELPKILHLPFTLPLKQILRERIQ
jgi:hypothetical protein